MTRPTSRKLERSCNKQMAWAWAMAVERNRPATNSLFTQMQRAIECLRLGSFARALTAHPVTLLKGHVPTHMNMAVQHPVAYRSRSLLCGFLSHTFYVNTVWTHEMRPELRLF